MFWWCLARYQKAFGFTDQRIWFDPPKSKRIGMGAQSMCFWCWYISGKMPSYFWISRGIYSRSWDNLLRNAFKKENLARFWTKIKNEKSIVRTHTVKALLPFVTTCLCECGFSALAQIKTKTRNCLEPEDDMRLALSKIVPNFDKVVETIQNQSSHWLNRNCFHEYVQTFVKLSCV